MKTFLLFLPTLLTAATPCQILGTLSMPDTRIQFAELTAATTMLGPGSLLVKTPTFCRVGGVIVPSNDSEIHFEVWLPSEGWNGRFRGTGNGGFAGSINYSEMAAALRDGYATASTDTGHRADGIDADWALGHPEKITDFGYRAIHEMTVKAKAVIQSFYGEAPKHSFFSSCSNGGRQALMEAQRFPEDYDGILAGAPANYWTHLLVANFYSSAKPMLENSASYISKDKIPAIAQAVLAACDTADGLKDGILSDPPSCHFDPSTMVCKGAETNSCLTPPQAASLKRIYAGARGSDGTLIFPGYEPGGEDGGGGWSAWITGPKAGFSAGVLFSTGFLRNMVFNNSAWTYKGTNLSDSLAAADSKMANTLNSTDANLKPFQARGGKLIIYHGWSDAAIPAVNAISYYHNVTQTLGENTVDSFVRLYLPPGMQHCAGGPGPNLFGQFGVLKAGDAQHDIFTSLVEWVEKGSAPGAIVATKYTKDDPAKPIEMTRPICPYPLSAKYDGNGDSKQAESFTCAAAR
jgi:tannase/feruloyl esterase